MMHKRIAFLILVSSLLGRLMLAEQHDLVDVQSINPHIAVNLYFACTNNFAHCAFYDDSARAYLRRTAAEALSLVEQELETLGFSLLVVDAYRPLAVQKVMWQACPNPDYVIDPTIGSRHNYGNAVDVLLINKDDGTLVSMPTEFFANDASRDCSKWSCTQEAKRNCKLLELIMEKYGFKGLASEWWHFDFGAKEQYKRLDTSFTTLAAR